MTVISVIVGSTRQGRFSEKPAHWILQHLKKRADVDARDDDAARRLVAIALLVAALGPRHATAIARLPFG